MRFSATSSGWSRSACPGSIGKEHHGFHDNGSRGRSGRPGPHHHRIGLHPRTPAPARRARATLRPRPVGQADRSRHPVRRRTGIIGWRRFRGARAGGGAGGAGPSAGRGAVPGVGDTRRGRAGEVRLRLAAAGVGNAGDQRRKDHRGGPRRRDGRGPGAGPGRRRHVSAHRLTNAGRLWTGGRCVPGSGRNRFGYARFS